MLGNIDANTGDPQTGNFELAALELASKISFKSTTSLEPFNWNHLKQLGRFRFVNWSYYVGVGWDTDQFMTDIAEATMVMTSVIRNVSKTVDSLSVPIVQELWWLFFFSFSVWKYHNTRSTSERVNLFFLWNRED